MFYVLSPDIGLRYFTDIGYCYIRKHIERTRPRGLTEEEYKLLSTVCDGRHLITEEQERILHKFEFDDVITVYDDILPVLQYKWQDVKTNNRYVSEMEVSITQRCNYNCMYCFTTADAAPLTDSFTLDEFVDLVDQALDCGFNTFAFTGGEPMVHKNFREMIQAVYSRGMTVSEIMTNGSLITDEFIDWLKNMYYLPRFCISFDGINGKHDVIRQTHSENIVLDNIRKLLKNGFEVKVTYNLSKFNLDELRETTKILEEMGVDEFRIARTMPAPKWHSFAPGTEIDHEEWIKVGLEYCDWYMKENIQMDLDFWNLAAIIPGDKTLGLSNIRGCHCNRDTDKDQPLCPLTVERICVMGNGGMTPCQQVSGILKYEGIDLGNVKETPLSELLVNSEFSKVIYSTVESRKDRLEECKNCKYWEWCLGGCPIICWNWRHDKGDKFPYYLDETKCAFFKNGYYEKFKEIADNNNYILHGGDLYATIG